MMIADETGTLGTEPSFGMNQLHGNVILPACGGYIMLENFSFSLFSPYKLTVQNRGLKHHSFIHSLLNVPAVQLKLIL